MSILTKRKIYYLLQTAVCIALAAWLSISAIAVYREGAARKAENPLESIYTPEIVAEKAAPMAPLFLAGLVLLITGIVMSVKDGSVGREKNLFRKTKASQAQLKGEKETGGAFGHRAVDPPKKTGVLQAVIIAAAIVFIIAGVLNGSAGDVLYKAITICTECVGLG